MNKNLRYFQKINKIEIEYPDKDSFIVYNDILNKLKIKINDLEVDISSFKPKSRYLKQIKFETVIFIWLEKEGFIKNFSKNYVDAIIPSDEYCIKEKIFLIRNYN